MDAVFRIKASEFNEALFVKIKSLLKGSDAEITIAVSDKNTLSSVNEQPAEYVKRIQEAENDLKEGKGIAFTMEELKSFVGK